MAWPGVARIGAGALWSVVAIVLLTGVPMWFWYAPEPAQYAAAAGRVGNFVRVWHAAAAVLLVFGALWHGIKRRGVGERSGVLAFLAVALAALTGVGASPTSTGRGLWHKLTGADATAGGLDAAVLVHVAVAGLLALALLYVHGSRTRFRASPRELRWGVIFVLLLTIVSAAYEPGIYPDWWMEFPLWLLAPPVTMLWVWTLAAGIWLWARLRFRPGSSGAPQ